MKKKASILLLILFASFAGFAQRQKDPAILLGSMPGSTVTRAQLLANPKFTDKNGTYNVTHFTITFFPKGHDLVGPFFTNGNALSVAELSIIKSLATPAKIIIDDIKATGSDGQPRSLNSIELKVIE